jgi:CRP/FNR family cyclic AMP-dependent transcriptional regulator
MDTEQLKRIPLFASLSEGALQAIGTFAESKEVPDGTEVVREGAYSNEFMAIEEGTAAVTRGGQKLADLGPGDIFGETGLVEKSQRTASVTATSRMKLIVIKNWELSRLKKKDPTAYEQIAKIAQERKAD